MTKIARAARKKKTSPVAAKGAAARRVKAGPATQGKTPRTDIGRALGMSMLRAREVVMAKVRPVLRRHGLSDQQWRILRFLDANADLSPSELSRYTIILLPSLLRILKVMEADGLVRQDRAGSGTRVRVTLTRRGAELMDTVYPEVANARRLATQHLTSAETDVLLALLRKLFLREGDK